MRITLKEAKKSFFSKPSSISVIYADAFTITPDPHNDGWDLIHYWCKSKIFNAQLALNEGYIYILENKGQPGILKIGYTNRIPQDRVREINSGTGVITPWFIIGTYSCKSPQHIEALIHEKLNIYHINKEGFGVSFIQAENIIKEVISINKANI